MQGREVIGLEVVDRIAVPHLDGTARRMKAVIQRVKSNGEAPHQQKMPNLQWE
jgi:hypothetical protein